MKVEALKKAINALNEVQKTQLFEQIAISELNSRAIENNVQDRTQFAQQFTQELTQEVKNSQFNLAI